MPTSLPQHHKSRLAALFMRSSSTAAPWHRFPTASMPPTPEVAAKKCQLGPVPNPNPRQEVMLLPWTTPSTCQVAHLSLRVALAEEASSKPTPYLISGIWSALQEGEWVGRTLP